MRSPLVALLSLLPWSGGCGGNPGVMAGANPGASGVSAIRADATFVDEKAEMIVSTGTGIFRVSLDGKTSHKIFAKFPHKDVPQVSITDISLDWKTWLLSDSYTNLWIGDPATGTSIEVKALHGRMSFASVSPDGKWIAASQHSDYNALGHPDEDDTIFLIELATKKVETIPSQTRNWPTRVDWAADGSALLLTMAWEAPSQWLTIADKKRTEIGYRPGQPPPAPLRDNPQRPPSKCRQKLLTDKLEPEIRIVEDPEKPARLLVRLEGRERGFHDYMPDFSHLEMSPACKFVVFSHGRKVWVTDLAGAAIGPIIEGDWLFFLP